VGTWISYRDNALMEIADFAGVAALLFGAWVSGYLIGLIVWAAKRLWESV